MIQKQGEVLIFVCAKITNKKFSTCTGNNNKKKKCDSNHNMLYIVSLPIICLFEL